MGELGINAWGLAVQLIAFIVFIVLFWKYALGPITNMLDERSRRIAESMAAADAMKAEMARGQRPQRGDPGRGAAAGAADHRPGARGL